jgi:hypothetical protein
VVFCSWLPVHIIQLDMSSTLMGPVLLFLPFFLMTLYGKHS